MYAWKPILILSLLAGLALGARVFTTEEPAHFIVHVAFLLAVAIFLISVLIGVRGHIERWIRDFHHHGFTNRSDDRAHVRSDSNESERND